MLAEEHEELGVKVDGKEDTIFDHVDLSLLNSKEWKRRLGLQKIPDLVNVPIIHPRVLLQGLKIHRYILVDHLHDLSIDIESRSSKSVFILIIFSTPGKVFQVYFGQKVTLG